MTLVLQRKPQFDSQFRIQIDHADAVMALGTDTNMFPWIVLIFRVDHVITEDVVVHIFIIACILCQRFMRNNFSLQRKEQRDRSGPAVFFDYGITNDALFFR